jgi:hypothetical protein
LREGAPGAVGTGATAIGGYVERVKLERATYVTCDQCQALFKAGTFKDGTVPSACPTCRVGVDPKGQTVTIDTESRF